MAKKNYLIIAGTNKGGTTSLFDYLSKHPEINPSYTKQTFFFMDKEWQIKLNKAVVYDYETGFDTFDSYFKEQTGKYNLEASPDYLYVPGTAERLSEFFKTRKGKILFILREPLSRFNSLFYFGKQQGLIPNNMEYSEFYNASLNYNEGRNPTLMAYKTGFYSNYLEHYLNQMGKEKIKILFFEDLKKNPKGFMQNLCGELGVDGGFYKNFDFKAKNITLSSKNTWMNTAYDRARLFYMRHFYKSKTGILIANLLKNSLGKAHKKINFRPLEKNKLDTTIEQKLKKAYRDEAKKIKTLTGKNCPW